MGAGFKNFMRVALDYLALWKPGQSCAGLFLQLGTVNIGDGMFWRALKCVHAVKPRCWMVKDVFTETLGTLTHECANLHPNHVRLSDKMLKPSNPIRPMSTSGLA